MAGIVGVSARTIYRDLADLQAQGVPIEGERGVGYLLRSGYFLPPLTLTALEVEALQWGVAFVRAHADEALSGAAEELQVKIVTALQRQPDAVSTLLAFGTPLTRQQKTSLRVAREAIRSRTKLSLRYATPSGEVSDRVVRPLHLEHWGRVWTLTAWCELRDDFRAFRLDRIDRCLALADRFRDEPGKRFEDFLQQMASCQRPVS